MSKLTPVSEELSISGTDSKIASKLNYRKGRHQTTELSEIYDSEASDSSMNYDASKNRVVKSDLVSSK